MRTAGRLILAVAGTITTLSPGAGVTVTTPRGPALAVTTVRPTFRWRVTGRFEEFVDGGGGRAGLFQLDAGDLLNALDFGAELGQPILVDIGAIFDFGEEGANLADCYTDRYPGLAGFLPLLLGLFDGGLDFGRKVGYVGAGVAAVGEGRDGEGGGQDQAAGQRGDSFA